MKQFSHKLSGFTIPELVIAITILAILSTIGFVSFIGYGSQSRDVVRLSDINNIKKVLGLQKLDRGYYPLASESVDVTFSGATVWSQGVFGTESMAETGKIFGELRDPKYGNQYSYSVTQNRKEYQIGAYFEKSENRSELFSFDFESDIFSFPEAYASTSFDPNDLSPKIWLDAMDIDGDGNMGNNPSNGGDITAWNNKSLLGSIHNPTISNHGPLRYAQNGYQSSDSLSELPGVFIANNRGLTLNNSSIENGSIYYVVQKNDPFSNSVDYSGLGLYSSNTYYFGYNRWSRKNAIRLGSAPNISGSAGGRDNPYIFRLSVSSGNYEFFETGNRVSNGLTNGINGQTWRFNRGGSSGNRADLVVSEVLVFDYDLSLEETQMVEGYLAHKWEQVSSLPANHPYKAAPPEAITPPAPDAIPDAFVIDDVSNANPNQTYISNPFTVSGINVPVEISIQGGEYNIDGGSYTSQTGSVSQGAAIRVRLDSASVSLQSETARVTIGGEFDDFMVTTKQIDDQIDVFNFSPIIDAQRDTLYISETREITGINVPLTVSISGTGAQYKITDGIPVDVTGVGIASGNSQNSSNRASYAFDDDLSTGWGSPNGNFPVILLYDLGAGNAQNINAYTLFRSSSQNGWNNNRYSPSAWSFQGSNNGSSWVTLDSQTNMLIASGASPQTFEFSNSQFFRYYRIIISESVNSNRVNISEMSLLNLGSGTFTDEIEMVQEGDFIVVRAPSSSEYSSISQANLSIGGTDSIFTINTQDAPPDYDPDVFSFTAQTDAAPNTQYISHPINISGITAATNISISGGEYEINNSGNWSNASASNLVQNGDIISVRGTSHPTAGQTRNINLTVGSQSATYSITTIVDSIPDTISFAEINGVPVNTLVPSGSITITGINVPITIENISGGEYNINGGSWTSANGQLENNDVLTLRVNSSSTFNTPTTMSLDISGQNYEFRVITEQADITPDSFTFLDIVEADLSVAYISEAIRVTDINSPTAISIDNGEYRIGNGDFTSEPGFVNNEDEIAVRLTSANLPLETVRSEITIGGITDYFEIETKEVIIPRVEYDLPESNVYLGGDYNGIITYAFTGASHYVLASPSIIASDLSSSNFIDIVSQNRLAYNGFTNAPASYRDSGLTMTGGFDFPILDPLLFEGTRADLGSYSGLQEVDTGVRSVYNNFPAYGYMAKYFDTFSLGYLESILGESIGINPIKPYYCSDILRTKLVYNIAQTATINADTPLVEGMQVGINNGVISSDLDLDPEYISRDGNAGIDFSWNTPQAIGYIRIYNTIAGNSSDLTDGVITFYNAFGGIIDSQQIGFDTTGDYVVDLDFESIGKVHYAQRVRIQTTGGRQLSLREVEIYLGGDLASGTYRVDRDGLGGLSPYNVYCDMETDGGGWTRIGENYITNGKFLRGVHTPEYTSLDVLDNIIVDGSVITPPVYAADAFVLRHQGGVNQFYELSFDNIPGKYYAQEIRLGAWVNGTNSSIFSYDLDYETQENISDFAEFSTTQSDGAWSYVEARIPLDDVVDNFTWKIGDGIAGPIFVTDLNMEVYYK